MSLAHLVESEIEKRKVVRCGKQLHLRTKGGALRMAGPTDRRCYWCDFPRTRVQDVPEPTATEQDDWSPI